MFTIEISSEEYESLFVALTLGSAGVKHIPSPNTPPPKIAEEASKILEGLRDRLKSQMDVIREEFDNKNQEEWGPE